MSAPSVTRVLQGAYSGALDPDAGMPVYDGGMPDIFVHAQRHGAHVDWWITAGRYGPELAHGQTRTKGGARVAAIVKAQSPSIQNAARKAVSQ